MALGVMSSCTEQEIIKDEPVVAPPKITSFSLMADKNPQLLIEDVQGVFVGDSTITCWIPYLVSNKTFRITIEAQGEVLIEDKPYSEETYVDLKTPTSVVVFNSKGDSQKYMLYVHSFSGLPVMWIETVDREEIVSKDNYLRASFKLVEDVKTRAPGDIIVDSVSIKGRGNSTWEYMPKKSYRLKLDNKQPLLGEASDKSWVLINNYADKTMLRNQVAFYISKISNLDYTPSSHFVELMLNGQYNGTYLLCDKIKLGKSRVDAGEDGFLLEIDAKANMDEVVFSVPHLINPVNIKDPEVKKGDENFTYVCDYVSEADSILFSVDFKDPNKGWQRYMDLDSFVDWYLINEIAKNNDALLWSSCFMSLKRNDKLKMGPVWDFDIAFGNINYNNNQTPYGFWVKNASWFSRLFEDPVYVEAVKNRFQFFYSRKEEILHEINKSASYLKVSAQENEKRWHTLYTSTWPNYDVWGSYFNEVQSMKEWLNTRLDWLKVEYEKM